MTRGCPQQRFPTSRRAEMGRRAIPGRARPARGGPSASRSENHDSSHPRPASRRACTLEKVGDCIRNASRSGPFQAEMPRNEPADKTDRFPFTGEGNSESRFSIEPSRPSLIVDPTHPLALRRECEPMAPQASLHPYLEDSNSKASLSRPGPSLGRFYWDGRKRIE